MVHVATCPNAKKLLHKDSERFIEVEWSDEPKRTFETEISVTVTNGKGVLARVAAKLASAEADISHIDMDQDGAQDVTDLRFLIGVRDVAHLSTALRVLKRTPSVLAARRSNAAAPAA